MLKKSSKKRYYKKLYKYKTNFLQVNNTLKKIKCFFSRVFNKLPKKVIKSFIILICSFLFVIIFINREKLSPDYISAFFEDIIVQNQHGAGYPYKINGNKVMSQNFKNINNNAFVISDTTFVSLNASAKEMNKKQHCYQTPMIKVNDNREIIYDLGGKHAEIMSKSKSLHTVELENNIISAAASNNGIYAIATESNGFLGQLTVFSKDGKDIYYKYNFADHYITDIALSDNGKSAAVCGCSAQEGSLVSTVYVFDYKNEVPKLKLDYKDNMFIRIEYLSNGNIVAVGDRLLSVINVNNGEKKDYDYENKTLITFDINKKEGILLSLSLSEDGNNTHMILINKSGKVENIINTENTIKSVSYKSGKIAALSYENLYIYNSFGKNLKTIAAGNDARKVNLSSGRTAYILGITEIRRVKC